MIMMMMIVWADLRMVVISGFILNHKKKIAR